MHRGMIYSFIGVVILLSIVSCSPYYGVTKGYKLPLIEFPEPLDKERFVAYLDTAAVDDWEGVWLLVGPEQHCFMAIERINDMNHSVYYSHRIRMWSAVSYYQDMFFEQGEVLGYLGQGLYEDTKNMTMKAGILTRYDLYKSVVRLDKTRKHILIEAAYKNKGEVGMRRIYPIRSVEEDEYKVRYL